jgi:hypothetical protein
MAFTAVAIDIGLRNMALAEITVPERYAPVSSIAMILGLPWQCTAVQNLHLAGGTVADVCIQVFHVLRASGLRWEERVRGATIVVIESQNGKYSPQNYALSHAMQMWCYGARNHNRNVFFVNNAHKLHSMTLYGLIPNRTERLDWTDAGPAGATETPKKRKRGVSHHYNKKDVVDWVRRRAREHPDDVGLAAVLHEGGDKPDDVCDALTHALTFWWEQLESPVLRKVLKRRTKPTVVVV